MSGPSISKLEYAKKRSWHHRLPVRALTALSLGISIALGAAAWGRPTWNKLQLMYWQSRCMRYSAPADQVNVSARITHLPHAWQRFFELFSPPGLTSYSTAFLHERISRSGNRRLIAVDLFTNHCTGSWDVIPRIVIPGGMLSRPTEIISKSGALAMGGFTKLYAGQCDPEDSAHFVIRYERDAEVQVIDGWLGDDDTVRLEPREPITSSPSSASPPLHESEATAGRRMSDR